MTQIDHQLAAAVAAPTSGGMPSSYAVAAPPPIGYPTQDVAGKLNAAVPVETKSRGDGFWKGCCAALCCCCVLDACF